MQLKDIFSNQMKIYSESGLTQLTDTFALISIDTITPCYESVIPDEPLKYKIYFNKTTSDHVDEYRLRQIIFYDAKKAKWGIEVVAAAALISDVYDDSGNYIGKKPLFWFNIFNEKPKLTSNDIVWAKRLSTWKNNIELDSVKIFKGASINPMSHFIDALTNKPKMPFYSNDFSEMRKLSLSERRNIISWVDTLTETRYDTIKYTYIKRNLDVSKVRKLHLVQNWFWDENKKRLSVWLEAVAPMKQECDEEGNFLYEKTLFYQRNDD